MRKLDAPSNSPIDVYDICCAAVSGTALQRTYETNRPIILGAIALFSAATATASWANLPRVPRGSPNLVIAGSLTKKNLIDLYDAYMVGASGASRKVYDDILVAAGGQCPFCGGLGQVCTLDHYLPKANFPLYSVLPLNLVPCCRDCNTGKNASFSTVDHQQTLHPYLDNDKYFLERWVSAEVQRTNPVVMTFKCTPSPEWSSDDKSRVNQHFTNYRFARRYSIQAGAELSRLLDLRSNSLRTLSPEAFKAYLLENANSKDFDLNGWSRTMYSALAETDWFCMANL